MPRGQVVKRGSAAEAEQAIARATAARSAEANSTFEEESWSDVEHLIFEKNDRDNDGKLSAAELAAALMGRYQRTAAGDFERQRKALRMIERYDKDASGAIDEEEFHKMTRAVMGPPEGTKEEDVGSARRSGGGGGDEETEKDLGRSFRKRQRSAVMAVMMSGWVLAPLSLMIILLILSYRSTVRHSRKASRWASAGYTISNRAAKNR